MPSLFRQRLTCALDALRPQLAIGLDVLRLFGGIENPLGCQPLEGPERSHRLWLLGASRRARRAVRIPDGQGGGNHHYVDHDSDLSSFGVTWCPHYTAPFILAQWSFVPGSYCSRKKNEPLSHAVSVDNKLYLARPLALNATRYALTRQ